MSISALRVASPTKATASMIVIHGLGDSGSGWSWFADLLHQSDEFKHINLVFPNAPIVPVTVNGGYKMPAWFDIFEFGNPNAKQDVEGFFKSTNQIKQLIIQEISTGIPANRIIVGGFSQGAALSLATAATFDKKLAGVMCLSGFLPVKAEIAPLITDNNKKTPIFHGHGEADPIINFKFGKMTADAYKSFGFTNYEFNSYPGMAHSTCNQEMTDIMQFIRKTIGQ
ncbi:hypothetical protein CANARDRAFT_26884 [[Candida] arabinofermentans NRRL YB-2248]|uniref:Acyl-protein thioesterase 1 n=1 Tax=[Candida] arabinofermentans NRRL YB-2248 TaxID=983967 RepID=A0A1E4T6V6_9ASCO|nr:hypothetical protein CANARDRAFT_26884 [[Candida] arabinofermentans NRRL YB-2248]